MSAFWEGMLAGYGIAILVGITGVLIVELALRRGFVIGFMAGAGAATADFVYEGLAAVAGEAVSSALSGMWLCFGRPVRYFCWGWGCESWCFSCGDLMGLRKSGYVWPKSGRPSA
ncbi:MAG: hypothetical protein ACE5E7_03075 [Anaerolineae bacterium]